MYPGFLATYHLSPLHAGSFPVQWMAHAPDSSQGLLILALSVRLAVLSPGESCSRTVKQEWKSPATTLR